MDEEEVSQNAVKKIKKVLELFLEMISGLKKVASNHEDSIEALETAMGFQQVANEAVIEALKEIVEVQEGLNRDFEGSDLQLEIVTEDLNTLRARDKENRACIKALDRELTNLRALILKQYDIDLRQGGLFFQSWYEERDECLATVIEDAKRKPR